MSWFQPQRKREIVKIKAIVANVLHLVFPTDDSYDATTFNVYVGELHLAGPVRVSGVSFRGRGGYNNDERDRTPPGVHIEGVDGAVISDCRFDDFTNQHARMTYCVRSEITGCAIGGIDLSNEDNISGSDTSKWFTGLSIDSCHDVRVLGNTCSNARRLIDLQGGVNDPGSRHILVASNTVTNCGNGVGMHRCARVSIVGNKFIGVKDGISIRGKNVTITGNTIRATEDAIVVNPGSYLTPPGYDDGPGVNFGDLVIEGNDIECQRYFFVSKYNFDSITITNNKFRIINNISGSSMPRVGWQGRRLSRFTFAGNDVVCPNTSPIIRIYQQQAGQIVELGDISVTHNKFRGGRRVLDITGLDSPNEAEKTVFAFNECYGAANPVPIVEIGGGNFANPVWIAYNYIGDGRGNTISGDSEKFVSVGNVW